MYIKYGFLNSRYDALTIYLIQISPVSYCCIMKGSIFNYYRLKWQYNI